MNIDVAALLHQNNILLLFVVLAVGLAFAKVRIANMQLGNSIGVLLTALVFGNAGFTFNADALNIGFMLFIYCVGIEAGQLFWYFLSRWKTLPFTCSRRPIICNWYNYDYGPLLRYESRIGHWSNGRLTNRDTSLSGCERCVK